MQVDDSQSVGRWVSGRWVGGQVVSGRWIGWSVVGGSVVGGFNKTQKFVLISNAQNLSSGFI